MAEPEFKIEGNDLVLRVSLDALASATECSPVLNDLLFSESLQDWRKVVITDKAAWAKEVMTELHREEEDGTTLIHRMFDTAIARSFEQGAEGIETSP